MSEHPLKGSVVALRRAGWSYGKIAGFLKVGRGVVAGLLRRSNEVGTYVPGAGGHGNHRLPPAQRAEAARYGLRHTYAAAAEKWGVSRKTIREWVQELPA